MKILMIKQFLKFLTGVEFRVCIIEDVVFAEAETGERTGIALADDIVVIGPKEATDCLDASRLAGIVNIHNNVE